MSKKLKKLKEDYGYMVENISGAEIIGQIPPEKLLNRKKNGGYYSKDKTYKIE
jgi:hypothetical protein